LKPLITALLAAASVAVSSSAPTAVHAPVRRIAIHFRPTVDSAEFSCGRSYQMGLRHTPIAPSDFRLFIHDVALITTDGLAVPVVLNDDDLWQTGGVALLDFENGTGPCDNGTPEMRDSVVGDLSLTEQQRVVGLRFTIGVPVALNHQDITRQRSPLTLSQMFWAWKTGHKFLRIELSTTASSAVIMHLGSTGCQPREAANSVSCDTPNRPVIELRDFDLDRDRVAIDIGSLFKDVDLESAKGGCMSEPDNTVCAPMFAALGLPFGEHPAKSRQTVFRLQHSESASRRPGQR
jgi:uncharacterized repeat protein (TIGR04052 family)